MNRTLYWTCLMVTITTFISGCSQSGGDNPTNNPNHPPLISYVHSDSDTLALNATTRLVCSAWDEDGDSLHFSWGCSFGSFGGPTTDSSAVWRAANLEQSSTDTVPVTIHVGVSDGADTTRANKCIIVLTSDPYFDTGEPFVDEPDSSGLYNGLYDQMEPWIDRANEYGVNNLGVYDPWDPYVDLNGNGCWDHGEVYYDLPTSYRGIGQVRGASVCNHQYDGPNRAFDDYELFTFRIRPDSLTDERFPIIYTWDDVRGQPASLRYDWILLPAVSAQVPGYFAFLDGYSTWTDRDGNGLFDSPRDTPRTGQDLWYDTGEPFMDLPDSNGHYNGVWDPGEPFWDLPSSFTGPFTPRLAVTTNGVYDGPNGYFDEYELFTCPYGNVDPRFPVFYTWEDVRQGIRDARVWLRLPDLPGGIPGYLAYIPGRSTWVDANGNELFEMP